MPANNMSILFNNGSTVNINMNKVLKHVKSKQGIEAAKRFENNSLQANYWDPKDEELKTRLAEDSLRRYIDKVFEKLDVYSRAAINAQIRVSVSAKIQDAKDKISHLGLKNLGDLANKIMENAMERDKHLEIANNIYEEARKQGHDKLNSEQKAAVEMEYKQANAYNKKRMDYAEKRLKAVKENKKILEQSGPEAMAAFIYLHGVPYTGENFVEQD